MGVFSGMSLLLLALCVCLFSVTGIQTFLALPIAIWYLWLMGTNWKTAYWLLLFCIPFSVEIGLFNHTLSTSVPDEPMTWLFLLLLPLLLLYRPAFLPLKAMLNPVSLIVGLQVLWTIVAVIYSQDVILSLKYLLLKVWLLAAFFVFPLIIFRKKEDFITGFKVMLIPVAATMLIIMARHAMLGFRFMKINEAIGMIYYNHVEYSTVISMIFPLACMAWPLTRRMNRKTRLAVVALLALFVAAILFSYARAAFLAVIFAGMVGVGIRYRFARLIMPSFYAIVIAIIIYMAHEYKYLEFRPDYEQTYMHDDLSTHLDATFRGTDMSGMERVYRWIAAVRMSTEKPITGYGPNTFVQQYKSYTVPAFKTYVSDNTEHSTTHNYFLYMLAEQGWPAMILYALLLLIVLSVAQGTYHRLTDPFYRYCTLGLAMMFSAAFVNNCFSELTDTHKVGALFYISMALLAVLSCKSKRREGEEGITTWR